MEYGMEIPLKTRNKTAIWPICPLSYINAYIRNLEKCYWWALLQERNRDADVENIFVDTVGEGEGGRNRKSSVDIYTPSCVK